MPVNLNDELAHQALDQAVLLALHKLALDTEKHRSAVKQVQLEIFIEKKAPNPSQETISQLTAKLENLTRKERLEAEGCALANKAKMEHSADYSPRIQQIEAELNALGNRDDFLLNTEATNLLLCVAAACGLNESLAFLLENGASTTAVIDSYKIYPRSLESGMARFFERLEPKIKLAPRLDMNRVLLNKYPLELALAGLHTTTAEALVAAKANVNVLFGDTGDIAFFMFKPPTLLYAAADKGELFSVEFLIKHGADLDAADKYGNTALHRAAFKDHMPVVQALLDSPANPNLRASDNGNRTAADFGSPTIRALIKTYQNNNYSAPCVIM